MADEPVEEWRVIEQAPNYAISSSGRVRRISGANGTQAGRILKPRTTKDGYLTIGMWKDGKRIWRHIHNLVCRAFLGEKPSPSHQAAHNDGNKLNNSPGNLRWATAKENAQDRIKHGTQVSGERARHTANRLRGDANKMRSPERRARMEAILADKRGVNEAARFYRVSPALVSMIRNGKIWI